MAHLLKVTSANLQVFQLVDESTPCGPQTSQSNIYKQTEKGQERLPRARTKSNRKLSQVCSVGLRVKHPLVFQLKLAATATKDKSLYQKLPKCSPGSWLRRCWPPVWPQLQLQPLARGSMGPTLATGPSASVSWPSSPWSSPFTTTTPTPTRPW